MKVGTIENPSQDVIRKRAAASFTTDYRNSVDIVDVDHLPGLP